MSLKVSERHMKELSRYLGRLIAQGNLKYSEFFADVFYKIISEGEIKSKEVFELGSKHGITKFSINKKLTKLRDLEVLYPELKGLPKRGGYWVWKIHPEFIKVVKYLSKMI